MRLSRALIRHFRSVDEIEFVIPRSLAIVGENNSGKSNILDALHWLLTLDSWPMTRRLEPTDFHLERLDQPIRVCAWFELEDEEREYWARPHRNNLRQAAWQPAPGDQLELGIGLNRTFYGSDEDWFAFVDREGNPILYGRREDPQLRRISSEDHERFDAVLVGARREASRTFGGQAWTQWSRLLRDLVLSIDAADRARIDQQLAQVARDTKPLVLAELEQQLSAALARVLPVKAADAEIDLSPLSLEDAFRTAQIYVSDPMRTELGAKGMALQSAATISLYIVLAARRSSCTLLIEEPELFLHPHNQRLLLAELDRLAPSTPATIYSTHAPTLVHIDEPDKVLLVRRPAEATVIAQIAPQRLAELLRDGLRLDKLARPFDASRNEVFFARFVVLVEGESDRQAVHAGLEARGVSPDRLGISVIDVGGDGNVADYAEICRELGIPNMCLLDRHGNKAAQDAVEAASDAVVWMDPDLELSVLEATPLAEDFVVERVGEERVSSNAARLETDLGLDPTEARRESLRRAMKNVIGVSWPSDLIPTVAAAGSLPSAIEEVIEAARRGGATEDTPVEEGEEELPF